MIQKLSNKRAQAVMGEYVLTFFIIITVMTTMTIFLKRTLQGRIRDARSEMGNIVATRAGGLYTGLITTHYEPYYVNTVATVDRDSVSMQGLRESPGFSSGIFNQVFDERTIMNSVSVTAPPQLAN